MLRRDHWRQVHQVVGHVVCEEVGFLFRHDRVRAGRETFDQGAAHPSLNGDPTLLFGARSPSEDAHGDTLVTPARDSGRLARLRCRPLIGAGSRFHPLRHERMRSSTAAVTARLTPHAPPPPQGCEQYEAQGDPRRDSNAHGEVTDEDRYCCRHHHRSDQEGSPEQWSVPPVARDTHDARLPRGCTARIWPASVSRLLAKRAHRHERIAATCFIDGRTGACAGSVQVPGFVALIRGCPR